LYFLRGHRPLRAPHPFPTRRSSDLAEQTRLRDAGNADAARAVDALASKLITEPVRYGKPGLQAHISYLAGMTARTDQKVGRDAIDRKSTRLNSSHVKISYAVFCLKK